MFAVYAEKPSPDDPLASRLPYNTFGVIQLVNDGANAHYNAGSLKASKRFSGGLVEHAKASRELSLHLTRHRC